MEWDDLPPIEAPKTSLPRRKSFLNFGDNDNTQSQPKTASILKKGFDFPPIGDNETNEKHVEITTSKSNDIFENETQVSRPSRLLLSSGSLSSDNIRKSNHSEIVRPVLQQTSNPPVDDIFAENELSDSIFSDKQENKQEVTAFPRSSSLLNRASLLSQDTNNAKTENLLSQSDTPQSVSDSEFNEAPKNIPPRLTRRPSFLSNINNKEEMSSAPVQKPQINESSDIFKQESASFFSEMTPVTAKSPTDILEKSLCTLIDRSFSSFKRSVNREIVNSIRSTDNISQLTFDNFIDDLVKSVKSTIDESETVKAIDIESINSSFSTALNDGMKPIRRLLAEIEQKQISKREKQKEDLTIVNETVKTLSKIVSDITSSTLKELDTIKVQTIIKKESGQSQKRINATKLKTMKLRTSDYETRAQHQIMELESVEKMLKQTENLEKELENSYKAKQDVYCEKINKEIQTITDMLCSNNDTDIYDAFSQIKKRISDINDSLRIDINELSNMSTSFDASKAPFFQIDARIQPKQQFSVSAAERIYENRRFRELSKREFNERARILQENDPYFNSMY